MHPAAMEAAGWWFRECSVPAATPQPAAADASEPVLDPAAEAEYYARIYPDRAAQIRAHGGLPPQLTFGPPEPAIVAALVSGAGASLSATA